MRARSRPGPRALLAAVLPLVLLAGVVLADDIRPGGPVLDGTRATCDLDKSQHIRNVGGSDGAGLCVFTSCEVADSRWQRGALAGFQKWMTARPGGGYPDKLDQCITQFCREMKRDIPNYAQHTGGDEAFLDLALKTGRMVGVTYAGQDDFYRGQTIAHMVDLAHLDADRAAVIDNNRPGVWVWMTRKQFLARWRGEDDNGSPLTLPVGLGRQAPVGGGWAVVFLDPPPPPYTDPPAQTLFGQTCANGQCQTPLTWVPGLGWVKLTPTPAVVAPAPVAAPPAKPAPAEPKAEAKEEPKLVNHGVDVDRLRESSRWYLNGSETSRAEVMRAVSGAGLTDDSDRWFLVAVGPADLTAKVRAAAAQLDPAARDKLHVHTYAPTDWEVGQFALPAGVSLRKPARGRVGAEAGRFAGEVSAATLTRFVADCQAPPPAPMPKPDPTPAPAPQPDPTPAPPPAGIPLVWVLVIAGGAVLLFVLRRKS